MKDAIIGVYETASWKKKVNNMYDDQVIAIYHNFSERGILNKVLRRERPTIINRMETQEVKETYQQLNMFDLLNQQERRNV